MPWITIGLVLANFAMYAFDISRGLDWMRPDPDRMIALGGDLAPLTLSGEPWRMLTSMFMHGGAAHLAVNMYMLIVVGPIAERMFGRAAYFALYVAAGMCGAWSSAMWNWQHQVSTGLFDLGMRLPAYMVHPAVSVGASGALMGLAGALFARRIVEQWRGESDATPGLGKSIGQVILINLVMGAAMSGIDQAAHVGGVLGGLLMGAVVALVAARSPRVNAVAALALSALVCGGLYLSAASVQDEDIAQFRVRYTEQMHADQAKADAQRRRDDIEREAAEDDRKMPPDVSADEAAGTLIRLNGVGEHARDVALSADGKRAYVTDGEANALLVVDLDQGAATRVISGPALPRVGHGEGCSDNTCRGIGAASVTLSRDERFAYVASMVPDALSIVDLEQGRVVDSIAVGRFPRASVLSPDGTLLLVFSGVDNAYTVIDLQERKTLGMPTVLPGGEASGLPFGRPLGIWTTRDGRIAYLRDDQSNQVVSYAFAMRMAKSTIAMDRFGEARVLAVDEDHWWAIDDHAWSEFDPHTLADKQLFGNCENVAFADAVLSADGQSVALIDNNRSAVRLVKITTGGTIGLFPAPGARKVLNLPDGRHLLVLRNDGLALLDRSKSANFRDAIATRGNDLFCLQ